MNKAGCLANGVYFNAGCVTKRSGLPASRANALGSPCSKVMTETCGKVGGDGTMVCSSVNNTPCPTGKAGVRVDYSDWQDRTERMTRPQQHERVVSDRHQ